MEEGYFREKKRSYLIVVICGQLEKDSVFLVEARHTKVNNRQSYKHLNYIGIHAMKLPPTHVGAVDEKNFLNRIEKSSCLR